MAERIVWTRQHPAVWEELERTGRYIAREEAIRAKNGGMGEMSEFYLRLYRWYTREGGRFVPRPADVEYPVWVSLSRESMLQPVEGTVVLTLEVPEEKLLITDMERWGYRVNQWYIPTDPEDEKRHNEELRRYGIASEGALIDSDKGNFYPLLRSKIVKSWDRLFTTPPRPGDMAQAAVWELRREWVEVCSADVD